MVCVKDVILSRFLSSPSLPSRHFLQLSGWLFQVIGRHPTDAAFLLNAPFHDGDSALDIKYCNGTYQGGRDVLDWQKMEGPSLVRE
jgi:hypothetical protein